MVPVRHRGFDCRKERGVTGVAYGFGKLTKYYGKKMQRKRARETLFALLDECVGKSICG